MRWLNQGHMLRSGCSRHRRTWTAARTSLDRHFLGCRSTVVTRLLGVGILRTEAAVLGEALAEDTLLSIIGSARLGLSFSFRANFLHFCLSFRYLFCSSLIALLKGFRDKFDWILGILQFCDYGGTPVNSVPHNLYF